VISRYIQVWFWRTISSTKQTRFNYSYSAFQFSTYSTLYLPLL